MGTDVIETYTINAIEFDDLPATIDYYKPLYKIRLRTAKKR
jgi:hypothetical protein